MYLTYVFLLDDVASAICCYAFFMFRSWKQWSVVFYGNIAWVVVYCFCTFLRRYIDYNVATPIPRSMAIVVADSEYRASRVRNVWCLGKMQAAIWGMIVQTSLCTISPHIAAVVIQRQRSDGDCLNQCRRRPTGLDARSAIPPLQSLAWFPVEMGLTIVWAGCFIIREVSRRNVKSEKSASVPFFCIARS